MKDLSDEEKRAAMIVPAQYANKYVVSVKSDGPVKITFLEQHDEHLVPRGSFVLSRSDADALSNLIAQLLAKN